MAYLEFFQVPHTLVRYRGVQQVVVDVGQHQPGTVHIEDRMCGLDDLMHRVLDPHLAEPQLAELVQGVVHILDRDAHLPTPECSLASAKGQVRILPATNGSISQ